METPRYTTFCDACKQEAKPLFKFSVGYHNIGNSQRKCPVKSYCRPCLEAVDGMPRRLEHYEKTCAGDCGRIFFGDTVKWGDPMYCCKTCQNRKHTRAYRATETKWDNRYEDECKQCGGRYTAARSTSKFCSTACRVKAHRAKSKT